MFTVKLTDAEIMFCKMAGGMRSLTARAANVKDAKMGDLTGLQMDEDGMIGEYAFCKKMNIFPDVIPGPRSGSCDCVFMGKRIDIKTTRVPNGRLLSTVKNNDDVDVYVLAILINNTVQFPGFSTKKNLFTESNMVDLGHGVGFALTQGQLSPWSGKYCD